VAEIMFHMHTYSCNESKPNTVTLPEHCHAGRHQK